MQETGRRATPQFAGVDLRRPKGYPAPLLTPTPAPAKEEAAGVGGGGSDPCPRCESRETKFCYYNNYNTSQPRHFCKSCRRYWTKGGSLRNVPVGGGSRKSSSSSAIAAGSSSPAKSPKRSKNSKRRRVSPPPPEPTPPTTTPAAAAADVAAPTGLEASTKETPEDVAAAGAAATQPAEGGGFTDPSVALGLGLTEPGGKELLDTSPFEWPSGCDLGPYWPTGVFADTDPSLFLNMP
ncbi:hypothetical protein E2562_024898 [Oryza meyeriana var. granulata]|uniref:Dof zinc finger protein n=1 Tax=Oryza meyeriana var. granulata TaxID=110450 RepID=A0A6G1DNN4_9ORYZ|nr:hypothetical protein E2562_024898 [Oryza meyeriana var. granulata]